MARPLSLLLSVTLLLCMAPAFARTMNAQAGSGDDATCSEEAAAAGTASEDPTDKPVAKRGATTAPAKQKPATPYRGGGSSPARPPRWHRFLPGMFR